MNILAVDIGSYSLKAIHAHKKGDVLEVLRVTEAPNQLGIAIPTDDISKEKFTQQIQSFFTDNSLPIDHICLALPEAFLTTKVIQIPVLTDAELASAIGWQAEQNIPIPKEDLSLEYQVLYRPPQSEKDALMRVLLVGARHSIVNSYVEIFNNIGIEPSFLDTQTLSILRCLVPTPNDPVTLIAHIGFTTMDVSITRQGELVSVFSHPSGGMLLTRAIENNLQLSASQAEEYKRSYGLDPNYFEGKVFTALEPAVNNVLGNMTKAMQFFLTQYPQERIERIILSGGASQLPGLVTYAANKLGVEVLLLAPFAHAQGEIPSTNHSAYSVCMGLALRHD